MAKNWESTGFRDSSFIFLKRTRLLFVILPQKTYNWNYWYTFFDVSFLLLLMFLLTFYSCSVSFICILRLLLVSALPFMGMSRHDTHDCLLSSIFLSDSLLSLLFVTVPLMLYVTWKKKKPNFPRVMTETGWDFCSDTGGPDEGVIFGEKSVLTTHKYLLVMKKMFTFKLTRFIIL